MTNKESINLAAEVRRLVETFGKEAVLTEVRAVTTRKSGRPRMQDMPAFTDTFILDARDWLEGRDPNKRVSSRKLANDFAKDNPGHSQLSTFDRVYSKLRKSRKYFYIEQAFNISIYEYPISYHLRVLDAMAISNFKLSEYFDLHMDRVNENLRIFESAGGRITPDMTLEQIRDANWQREYPSLQTDNVGEIGPNYLHTKIDSDNSDNKTMPK